MICTATASTWPAGWRASSRPPPSGIVLSKQVHDHIGTNVPVRFTALGEQTVKNISRPVEAFRVDFSREAASDRVIRFREFDLDPARYGWRRAGTRVPPEPQAFDLLAYLARNRDRTISK